MVTTGHLCMVYGYSRATFAGYIELYTNWSPSKLFQAYTCSHTYKLSMCWLWCISIFFHIFWVYKLLDKLCWPGGGCLDLHTRKLKTGVPCQQPTKWYIYHTQAQIIRINHIDIAWYILYRYSCRGEGRSKVQGRVLGRLQGLAPAESQETGLLHR